MPVYNAGRFLEEAMDSMLNQTFTDFEFLIIDDCSTDNSVKIVESYNDSRIRLVKNEVNLGVAGTLNKGIQLASCELIARMDADDFSYPKRLQKQYDYFLQNPDCVLLYTFSRKIAQDRSWTKDRVFNTDHLYYNLLFHCPIRHPSVMYKRSAVMEVGMYDKTFVEDFNLWFRISRKYPLHHLPEILFEYRVTDSSTSRVFFKKQSETAHFLQVRNNVQFYTGTDFYLSDDEAEFLRGLSKAEPLVRNESGRFFVTCFKKLAQITASVQKKRPPFVSAKSIENAAEEKRKKLMHLLVRHGRKKEAVSAALQLGYWKLAVKTMGKTASLAKHK